MDRRESDETDPHRLLERFVVDNDNLLALEERLGRFNIFDALGVARAEIRHSNFLAWLLDPGGSHGQGSLFLRAILMDLMRQAPPEMRPLCPVELDGEELRGVEIRREWRNIDLLIACKDPPFVVAVENKIDASEHSEQLKRYKAIIQEQFRDLRHMFAFLTPDATEPSDGDWVPYSYADIHRVLHRIRRTNQGAIGDDVEAFLEHYLRLIGSRLMDDPTIDDLCQRIYKNHRQALELLFERYGDPLSVITNRMKESVASRSNHWHIVHSTSRSVYVLPREWLSWLPPVGNGGRKYEKRAWLLHGLELYPDRCWLITYLMPMSDQWLHERAIGALTRPGNPWRFRANNPASGGWIRLRSEHVGEKFSNDGEDDERIAAAVEVTLNKLQDRLASIPDALRPIIEEWRQAQHA